MLSQEKLIFEKSRKGRVGVSLPRCDVPGDPSTLLPESFRRSEAPSLPEVSEVDVVRHFTNLSQLNFGVDEGFYPLGSCTMKYNPKLNENAARLCGFSNIHPLQAEKTVQGALKLMYDLSTMLCEITGMAGMTLQPAAGAHGELTGVFLIKAYHRKNGDEGKRTKIIVPDSAHGTNPATASVAGYDVVEVASNDRGNVDIEALKAVVGEDTAGIMLTNPNTLGLFEKDILEIAEIVHGAGGLLYYDGANANAILGKIRPGDMGFDVLHLNLHKTFSTPHGGGGPGSGPVGVSQRLLPFLPTPVVVEKGDGYSLDFDLSDSIGKVRSFYGNFGVLVRAYAYIMSMGAEGLLLASENAVLNANYIMKKLEGEFDIPFSDVPCKHEFVISGEKQHDENGVSTLDMAKRLIDHGVHPPTIYFPLIVHEAMMVEPTETEGKETLDRFVDAMIEIAKEAKEKPEIFHDAPYTTVVSRLDETRAARKPVLRWTEDKG
ncbi:Glycine dehydrogenase (decarboxylating) [Dethiosulfovibrio peptidovorans DSM 11002]|uniref:Probable glycine dehydrogenase (decarboxylating) subunit 2 n=1 Tax=Dethiosulfovibrio peptidovorans DSM 11002 TaxID=469381 RepID=D2Z2I6_9BACT|nr:aminomethyl-transferring glycine dehydrogenase subunit GcvPB [Dethiosulfovibrio peptidovorans]EFC90142.1 Glycine dehydrogenase (decarboxylating) [Dethiosulfovibrio peptidovorans DSM 11002]